MTFPHYPILFRAHQLLVYTVISCSILFLLYFILSGGSTRTSNTDIIINSDKSLARHGQCPNSTYPGYRVSGRRGTKYRIAVIADLDTDSKVMMIF